MFVVLLEFCVWFSFCCAVLSVVSSIAIILLGNRELVYLFQLPFDGMFCVLGVQCLIIAFPGHTHLLIKASTSTILSVIRYDVFSYTYYSLG